MKTSLLRSLLVQLWLPVLLVLVLWVGTIGSTSFYFPPFTSVLSALTDSFTNGPLGGDLAFSLRNILIGLAIAIVAGVGVGIVIGETRSLRVASQPFLDFMRATPIVAFVPVVIVAFGVHSGPKIFLIAFGSVWPILLNTVSGVHGISAAVRDTVQAYRIPVWLRFRKVVLPGAAPQIFAGIRVSLSIAIVMMIVSEIYGSPQGLGYFIMNSGTNFAVADTWAGTLLIAVLGYLLTLVLILIEHTSLGWYEQRAPRRRRAPAPDAASA
ncbi:MAG: ABC transporter permease [Trebonia sp.]